MARARAIAGLGDAASISRPYTALGEQDEAEKRYAEIFRAGRLNVRGVGAYDAHGRLPTR